MPKKILNINNFSGGLNEKTTPKDLAPNEFQVAENMNNEVPGKLTLFGESVNGGYTGDFSAMTTLRRGYGLHHTSLDRNVDSNSLSNTEYLFVHDFTDKTIRIVEIDGVTSNLETTNIVYGNTSSAQIDMYTVDGSTKIIPDPYGTNEPKVFEYYNYDRRLGYTATADDAEIKDVVTDHTDSPLWLKPITGGSSVNALYDTEDLHGPGFFKPDYDSEIFMWNYNGLTMGWTSSDTLTSPSEANVRNVLDEHSEYFSPNYGGSMAMFATFTNGTSAVSGGNILVSASYRYGFFASLVYKSHDDANIQESFPVFIGTADQDITNAQTDADQYQKLYIMLVGRLGNKNKRYSGIKIYWARINEFVKGANENTNSSGQVGSKYLFAELDFEKGIRYAGDNTYSAFGITDLDATHAVDEQYIYPTGGFSTEWEMQVITDLSVLEPYTGNKVPSGIGQPLTGFKTSTIINRRVYAGNVTYYDEHNKLVAKADRVIKSTPNEFDNFPANSFLDAAVEDGDEIIKLESVNSKLLQFKKNKLYIINCQRDLEFIEATLDHKGCEKPYHVCKGPGFVAWFNKFGVYLYDGQQIIDLDISRIGQSRFTSIYDKLGGSIVDGGFLESFIGYLPDTRELVIANPNSTILKYDMKSESWSEGTKFENNSYTGSTNNISRDTDADFTNFVNLNNGDLVYLVEQTASTVKMRKWNNDPAALDASSITLYKSKEYDMDMPSVHKNITTIYINYRRGENVEIKGFAVRDGSSVEDTFVASTTQELTNTTNDFRTQKINVTNTAFKHINSFGIILYGTGIVHKDFEVNDIQIVFREKVAR